MAIISISRPFCSKGKLIAEEVARRLGYECISREILIEASGQFNVPEVQLAKAIHDGPSFFERLTHGKEKYVAIVRAALLNYVKKDKVVYHGLAGHFFLQGISHAIKVRTVADLNVRVQEEMIRENVTETVARKRLQNDDIESERWSQYVYGMDQSDPELYDIILNLNQISIDDCVGAICHAASFSSFATTEESARVLGNLALAATAKAMIVERYPDAITSADDGVINIQIPHTVSNKNAVISEIEKKIGSAEGVRSVAVNVQEEITPRSLMYMSRS